MGIRKIGTVRLIALLVATLLPSIVRSCGPSNKTCEFRLDVRLQQIMVDKSGRPVFLKNGSLYLYNVTNTSTATPVPPEEVITADGFDNQRLILVINEQFPGPTIEVYAGQKVVIYVKNNLFSDTLSFHWHGIHQRGTPWMDGAAFITQCPILPGHTFRYEFTADRPGTFFYHNHLGTLSTMGVQGAFIVRPNPPEAMPEHVAMVTEWNHEAEGRLHLLRVRYHDYSHGKRLVNVAPDGTFLARDKIHSGLVNGRGRYYDENGVSNFAPLTTFNVTAGEKYRFRVIGAGFAFPFRVSVDGHSLTLIASDGYDIEPVVVDSFIMHSGERYDFVLHADQNVSNYWFRAQTLEAGVDHRAEAIIHYAGAPDACPESTPRTCVHGNHCRVFNCPFAYPTEEHTDCIPLTCVKSKFDEPFHGAPANNESIPEYFLNFGRFNANGPPTVNGKRFKLPINPPLTQPNATIFPCNVCNPARPCMCTQSIEMPCGGHVQFVLLNMGQSSSNGNHPIHIHGHVFQVLKIGLARQNQTTKMFEGRNEDIMCNNEICAYASWANSSWTATTVPGLLTDRPPLKDTLTIPQGGYAVVRVRADNPGLWMLHCHMSTHLIFGMGIVLRERMNEIPKIPNGFPTCGQFLGPTEGPNDVTSPPPTTTTETKTTSSSTERPTTGARQENWEQPITMNGDTVSNQMFWAVSGCLIAVVALQSVVIVWVCRGFRQKSGKAFLNN